MEILCLGVGILVGIALVCCIRLLEIKTNTSTESFLNRYQPNKGKGEILLDGITVDQIADKIASQDTPLI